MIVRLICIQSSPRDIIWAMRFIWTLRRKMNQNSSVLCFLRHFCTQCEQFSSLHILGFRLNLLYICASLSRFNIICGFLVYLELSSALLFSLVVLSFQHQAMRSAGKNISNMTCFVLSGTSNFLTMPTCNFQLFFIIINYLQ